MFVLCPHCHFLVGMDPRSGRPPAACPKCHGVLAEPASPPAHEAVVPPATLDPFAEAALPSVAPALVEVEEAGTAGTAPADHADLQPAAEAPRGTVAEDAAQAPSTTGEGAVAGQGVAEAATPAAPRADAMIAAMSERPARKPRPARPRERKPRAASASKATAVDAAKPPAESPGAAPPSPSTPAPAASTPVARPPWARLRQWFRRASPRPATPPPPAAPPEASLAPTAARVPALSIRNRRRRAGEVAIDAASTLAPADTGAPAAGGNAARPDDSPDPAIADASGNAGTAGTPGTLPPRPQAADAPAGTAATSANSAGGSAGLPRPAGSPHADAPPRIDPPGDAQPVAAEAAAEPTTPSATTTPAAPRDGAADAAASMSDLPEAGIRDTAPAPEAALPPTAVPPPALATSTARAAPSFASTQPATRPARRDLRAPAILAGLAVLLAAQLLLAQRDTLAADARWRPAIASLCSVLRCQLPPWREPAAFTMLSRHVRPHPQAPGTLQVDASFRNDARWPQPWPRLELSLADIDGRVVGARTFAPAEYLGAAPAQPTLAPGQTAAISLAVVEPAPDIVAFSFDFR